jgi:hypothetical protein
MISSGNRGLSPVFCRNHRLQQPNRLHDRAYNHWSGPAGGGAAGPVRRAVAAILVIDASIVALISCG